MAKRDRAKSQYKHERSQSGFRPSHSTTGALLNITEDIRQAMEDTKLTAIILLDFSSAFNSVDFDILLGALRAINISASVIEWFSSFLFGRQQCVKTSEGSSDWITLTAGVPQGGVLSPLLFSVFINNISRIITSPFHLYADDLQLYRHFTLSEVAQTVADLNCDLSAIQAWARSFGLVVNPAKSQVMIVGSSRLRSRLDWSTIPALVYEGVQLAYTDKVKNLGLILDGTMSWTPHVNEITCLGLPNLAKVRPGWIYPECSMNMPRDNSSETPVKGMSSTYTMDKRERQNVADDESMDCTALNTTEEFKIELALEIKDFRSELKCVREEMKVLRQEMAEYRASVAACNTQIDNMERRLDVVEQKLNERDQELLSNDVEIVNIPEIQGENLYHIASVVAAKLGVPLEERNIVSVSRVGGAARRWASRRPAARAL
ncbi:uncharacterized protein LOC131855513 [Achroia grisella]|uniref:uncharacterized protein LOC131855513 n=1 Tax=Achroia grisella TaxID=688607 RepID=UPI0027D2898D|nr:uncharacterized protein LOC131855513 [Achroia grisella]